MAAPVRISLRDAKGNPVSGAVVYLQGSQAVPTRRMPPAVVDQRDKVFVPEVTVIQAGTEVHFPNSDTVAHHVYSFAQPNAFELPLYKGKTSPVVQFDKPGIVTLGCNIHDAMLGYIVIVETPYFGTSDEQGGVTLGDIPKGDWELRIWSPRLNPVKPVHAGVVAVGGEPIDQSVRLEGRITPVDSVGSLAEGEY